MTPAARALPQSDYFTSTKTTKKACRNENSRIVEVDLTDKLARSSLRLSQTFVQGADDLRKFMASPPLSGRNIVMKLSDQEQATEQDDTELHEIVRMDQKPNVSIWKAAEYGDLDALKYYIQTHTADPVTLVNKRDPDSECTLLHIAVSNNANPLSLLQLLLQHGADATARNVYNVQPIHALPLHCPDPLEPMKLLLEHEVDVNARDGDDWTPLHYAARFCKNPEPVMRMLLQHGANINAVDRSNKTPLFSLLANGDHARPLDMLIHETNAQVGIQGDFLNQKTRRCSRGTILLQAAKYDRFHCMTVLLTSSVARKALHDTVTHEELEQALAFLQAQPAKHADLSDCVSETNQKMVHLLQEFRQALQQDPTSAFARGLEAAQNPQLVRRSTRRLILGSIRRTKRQPQEDELEETVTLENNVTRRPSLLKRMGHLLTGERVPVQRDAA